MIFEILVVTKHDKSLLLNRKETAYKKDHEPEGRGLCYTHYQRSF